MLNHGEVKYVSAGVFIIADWLFITPSTGISEHDFNYIDQNVGLYLNNILTLAEFGDNMALVSEAALNQYYYNFQFVTMIFLPSTE